MDFNRKHLSGTLPLTAMNEPTTCDSASHPAKLESQLAQPHQTHSPSGRGGTLLQLMLCGPGVLQILPVIPLGTGEHSHLKSEPWDQLAWI